MGILVDNDITCEISVRDGAGEISSATFSVALDPISTNDLTQIRTKADNRKPYIMGITTLDNYISAYDEHGYKGLMTQGSGVGVTLTLTFSSAIDHFTLYFDEKAESMPLALTVNGVAYTNDDYIFAYMGDTALTTYTIVITDMNKVNNQYMPLMIVGIESAVGLKFDKRNGLQEARLAHTYTSKIGMPQYGIISQEGALRLFDFNGEVEDLIAASCLDANTISNFAMGKETKGSIGKYTTRQWTDKNNKDYAVSLGDFLLSWQKKYISPDYDIKTGRTAYNLYTYLTGLSNATFVCNSSTTAYFSELSIQYYYIENDTLWNLWRKFCEFTQSYLYVQYDGTVRVISQVEIESIKANAANSNIIVIPYNSYTGLLNDKIISNKIQNVEINYITSKILQQQQVYKDTYDFYKVNNNAIEVVTNAVVPTFSKDSSLANYDIVLTYTKEMSDSRGYYIVSCTYVPISIRVENLHPNSKNSALIQTISQIATSYQGTIQQSQNVSNLTPSSSSGTKFNYFTSVDAFLSNYFDYYSSQYHLKEAYVGEDVYGIVYNGNSINLYAFLLKAIVPYNDIMGTHSSTYNLNKSVAIFYDEMQSQSNKVATPQGIIDFSLPLNEYMSYDIAVANANRIKSVFTGKQTIKFKMALINLFYKNGNLAYNMDIGQELKLFDIIEIKDSNGTALGSKLWQISKVELIYDGAKFINVEAVEI